MTNYPAIRHIQDVSGMTTPKTLINNRWVLSRSLGYASLPHRIKAAWLVFTGKADALIWEEGQ